MAKYVLVADTTLVYEYRNFPLLDFLPCAPVSKVPGPIYNFLKGKKPDTFPDGQLRYAPYSLRKLEASLLQEHPREDVVVTDINSVHKFIDDKTEIVGVTTMDPYGIGPLTMSYAALFGGDFQAWVRVDWYRLINRINALRKGRKAKLVVGGPGVWELTTLSEEFERQKIDYAVQGEMEDVINRLFEQLPTDSVDTNMFRRGYTSFDENFKPTNVDDHRFVGRTSYGAYPSLEKIPTIVRPAMKAMVEIMRGCGIGCDFCEVTLRPLRYYEPDKILKEVEVNIKQGGFERAWMHTDEIFAYKHKQYFHVDEDALADVFTKVMSVPGVKSANPTHARISIPAGYPEMIARFSKILKASRDNWVSVQVGLETGSEAMALKHMPNKTLPLKIGADGGWQEIVWKGLQTMTKYYWRPAFTVQVGQKGETDEDNWDTVALINRLSNSYVEGRPFEFTVTPMLNVPLGRIKGGRLNRDILTPSMLAVYYASYRHLSKMVSRDVGAEAKGNPVTKSVFAVSMHLGGWGLLQLIEGISKKAGVDLEKVKDYGVGRNERIENFSQLSTHM